jgi:hypothetical protein
MAFVLNAGYHMFAACGGRYSPSRMLKVVVALASTKPFVIAAEHLLFTYAIAPVSISTNDSSSTPSAAPSVPLPKILLKKKSSARMSPRKRRRGGGGIPLNVLWAGINGHNKDVTAPKFSAESPGMVHCKHPTTINDITSEASFEIFCDLAIVQETDAVFKRHAELNEAIHMLRTHADLPTSTADDHGRLVTVEKIARAFSARWHLDSDEKEMQDFVRRKVRRDVKQSLEWDSELSQLSNPLALEDRLVEVMSRAHMTRRNRG